MSTVAEEVKTPTAVLKAAKEFSKLFSTTLENLYKACKLYAEVLNAYPLHADAFRAERPEIIMYAWSQFERVGEDKLAVELFPWFGCPAIKYIAYLPTSVQRKYAKEPVMVFSLRQENGKNIWTHKLVSLQLMTGPQADQVFSSDGYIRNEAQQRAFFDAKIEEEVRKEEVAKATTYKKPWKIVREDRKKKVLINAGPTGSIVFEAETITEMLHALQVQK